MCRGVFQFTFGVCCVVCSPVFLALFFSFFNGLGKSASEHDFAGVRDVGNGWEAFACFWWDGVGEVGEDAVGVESSYFVAVSECRVA